MRQKIGVTAALGQLQGRILEGSCPGLGVPDLEGFYAAISANKFYADARSRTELYQQKAALAVAQRDLDLAINYMDKAYQADPNNIQLPLQEALWLADAGLFDDARRYLSIAGATRPMNYFQKFQYREQLRIAEEQITAMKKQST
jgi:tetratricopeptide (TPR) repeat protein